MSGKESKTLQSKKPQIYQIQWYPSAIGCMSTGKRKVKPKQMPPLMVRKAEWRR
ncbi:MAG: hypothetical protein WCZ89_07300 [Phycisphaerae bacterium]